MLPGRPPSLSPRADGRAHGIVVRLLVPRDLGPTVPRWTVENPDVAAREKLERFVDAALSIELRAAGLAERLEPGRVHEVGHRDSIGLVGELVGLAGVADLVGIKPHPAVRLIDDRRRPPG